MYKLDHAIFKLINSGLASTILDPIMLTFTALGTGAAQMAISLALITLGWHKNAPKLRQAGYAGIVACATTCIVIAICKSIWNRPRPILTLFDVRVVGDPLFTKSFPSGHTLTAWAVAVACSTFAPKLRFVLFPLAVFVGISRVYVGDHFPLDVIFGALIGAIVGKYCGHFILRIKPNSPTERSSNDEA
jgi:undecaprenyl-diphosphatase